MWNRTLIYLGLREEPEEMYDEVPARFVPEDDPYAAHALMRGAGREPSVARELATAAARGGTEQPGRAQRNGAHAPVAGGDDNVRPLRAPDPVGPGPGAASRVAVVEVARFDDVEAVGARYRTGQAVLFDVSGASSATARRAVDFVAGLTYALRGKLHKVGSRAFLLVPDGVELLHEERRRLTDLGYRLPTGSDA
ncbi:MAG: cell division protein SepF [Nitriliruptoraceae bacterium]